jgi:uncharacterized protein (TIGR02246 family)
MKSPRTKKQTAADPAEDEIRAVMGAWSEALEARDPEGLAAGCASDVRLFDVKPPYEIRGRKQYRAMWQECLPYFPEKFRSERSGLEIAVSGYVAFAHCMHRIVPIGEEHPAAAMWMRVTACFRRIGGQWQAVHEHVSIPFDPTTGQAVPITKLDAAR